MKQSLQKMLWSIVLIIVVAGLALLYIKIQKNPSSPLPAANTATATAQVTAAPTTAIEPSLKNRIILFYRETCPHCQNVESFLKDNQIEQKLSFEKKELTNNDANVKLLMQIANTCHIAEEELGVPLLWNGSTCLTGDQDVINYFKHKVNLPS
jgi:hypothetical protein